MGNHRVASTAPRAGNVNGSVNGSVNQAATEAPASQPTGHFQSPSALA